MSEERNDAPAIEPIAVAIPEPAPSVEPAVPVVPEVAASPAEGDAAPPAPETPAVEVPAPLENLLSGTTEKPADAAVAEKPASEIGSEEPAKPAYEWQPFTPPEDLPGLTLDQERVKGLQEILIGEGLSPQERRDQLLAMHVAEMRAYDERTLERQIETFQNIQRDWIEKFKGDPEIGGSAARTHQNLANAAINQFLSRDRRFGQPIPAAQNGEARESDHSAFMDALKVTGAINHPEIVRFMARVGNMMSEPARAAPAIGASAVPRDIGNRRPSTQAGNPGRGAQMRDNYDHPRSQELFSNGSGR